MRFRGVLAIVALTTTVVTGCSPQTQPRPEPTGSASPAAVPTPTRTASDADGELAAIDEAPVEQERTWDELFAEAAEASLTGYRTVMGTSPDHQVVHEVGLDGDHSLVDGVDFSTPDGNVSCSIYSPYFPEDDGSQGIMVACHVETFDPSVTDAGCHGTHLMPTFGVLQPPSPYCGAWIVFPTDTPALPTGEALTWGQGRCATVDDHTVVCRAGEYMFMAGPHGIFRVA
jgi:hypothetical protein